MKIIVITLISVLISSDLFAQSKIGQSVGEFEFAKIVNSEKATNKLSDFKSTVVILDFWATWCSPCIESLSHLEKLQDKFSNDVKILTITDESEERIHKFLQKRNVSLPIVLDIDGKLSSAFPHRSISHTIVIDKNGIVQAVTSPEEITEETLAKIIKGQPAGLAEKIDNTIFDPSKPLSPNDNITYQITVTPYQDGLLSMADPSGHEQYEGRRILCTNLVLGTLYQIAYKFSNLRTIIEATNKKAFNWSRETAICFDLIVPKEMGDQRFEIMKQQLANLYGFKPVIEKRTMDVKILKRIKGKTLALKAANGGEKNGMIGGKGLSMKNAEVKYIAEFLETQLNIIVIDETDVTGLYDLELSWYNENPNQIYEELKKIGLELVSGTRAIEVLAIYDK